MKSIGKTLGIFLLVGGLGGWAFLQTRQGHHVLYKGIAKITQPYGLSFAEEDLYLFFPMRIACQQLTANTQWGPCPFRGVFLSFNPLQFYKRFFPHPTHKALPLPPELLSCRIQEVAFPPDFPRKNSVLQDIRLERVGDADTLWLTLKEEKQQATLTAQIGETVTFTIKGTLETDQLHIPHLKITGTASFPFSENGEVTWQATAPSGEWEERKFQDISLQGTTRLGATFDTRLQAEAKGQEQSWTLRGDLSIDQQKYLTVRTGDLSCSTMTLHIEEPLVIDLDQLPFPRKGKGQLTITDMKTLASFWDLPLMGQGTVHIQCGEASGKAVLSLTAQVNSLHYEDWKIAQGTLSGTLPEGDLFQFSLKGEAREITSPYGPLPTCSWELVPANGAHAFTLETVLAPLGSIRVQGSWDFQKGSGEVHTLQSGILKLHQRIQGTWHHGRFHFSGGLGWKEGNPLFWKVLGTPDNFSVQAQGKRLFVLKSSSGKNYLSGQIFLKGLPFYPEGNATATLADRTGQDLCEGYAEITPEYLRGVLHAKDHWGDSLNGEISFAPKKKQNFLSSLTQQPFSGTVRAKVKIGRLLELLGLLPEGVLIDGWFNAALEGIGNLQAPTLSGTFAVHEGLFELGGAGTAFYAINISGIAQGNRLVLQSVTLRDRQQGKGSITGFLTFLPELKAYTKLQLNLHNLLIIEQDDLKVAALGSIYLSGQFPNISLTGKLTLPFVDFLIVKSSTEDLGNLHITERGPHKERTPFQKRSPLYLPFLCSVTLPCPEVEVHGQSVESLWRGTLKLVGGREAPIALEGLLHLRHGHLDLYGRHLPFTHGKIVYTAQAPLDPAVHLKGRKALGDLEAFLAIVTTPTKTYFQLTSWPDHSVEDILSLLLFNKFVSVLSPPEMVQLLHAASGFQGETLSPLEVLDTMREISGIDTVLYNTETEGGTLINRTLTLGKYINNRIFVGLDNELDLNTTELSVQVTLTQRTMLEARTNGEFGLTWRQPF
ncbi:MAG: translocation/assembly module TamB [Holosporales bacterium]|jgi:hypothetical protein|nr:translocation/assembly module TamB [Holosporales bacterium]